MIGKLAKGVGESAKRDWTVINMKGDWRKIFAFEKCNEASGWGLVFGSSCNLKCIFTPAKKGAPIRYTDKIRKYGVDIGYHQDAVIYWAVLAPSEKFQPGEFAGTYRGG